MPADLLELMRSEPTYLLLRLEAREFVNTTGYIDQSDAKHVKARRK